MGWQISRPKWRKHPPLSCGKAEFGRRWGEWTPGRPGARRQTHGAGTPAALAPGPRLPWKAPADQVNHCENTNSNATLAQVSHRENTNSNSNATLAQVSHRENTNSNATLAQVNLHENTNSNSNATLAQVKLRENTNSNSNATLAQVKLHENTNSNSNATLAQVNLRENTNSNVTTALQSALCLDVPQKDEKVPW